MVSINEDAGEEAAARARENSPPGRTAPRIGLLGIQADTANLGLAALTYSVVFLLDEGIPGDAEIVLFSDNSRASMEQMLDELRVTGKRVRARPFRHKRPHEMLRSLREMHACDVVLDFTGGDSFSDIYGAKRLVRKLLHKEMVLLSGTPLVLAPQTYGPLRSRLLRPWYRHVVGRAQRVFTRDDLSVAFLRDLTARPVMISTDVATRLPYDPSRHALDHADGLRVGLNVSGLLWNTGRSGSPGLGLSTDYRRFCSLLVVALLERGHVVYLVPHVVQRSWEAATEDDLAAAKELQLLHPATKLAPPFGSPIDAKSWISGLDAFIGSRMHATIAALSSDVPTVAAAYSRKFAGFFGNLGHSAVVDLAALETEAAVEATLDLVSDLPRLRAMGALARASAHERLSVFTQKMASFTQLSSRG